MKKTYIITLAVLALLVACGKGGEEPTPINQEISEYGKLQPIIDAFEEDQAITCKSRGGLYIDDNQYAVLSGLKNSHLYFQALDMEKQEIAKTFEGKTAVSSKVEVYVGYGETVTKEIESILPTRYLTTPEGCVISWYAAPVGMALLFQNGAAEKVTDFMQIGTWSESVFYPWENAVLLLPDSGEKRCYSFSGDILYTISADTHFIKYTDSGVYKAVSEREAIRFFVDTSNSGRDVFQVVRLNLETGKQAGKAFSETAETRTNPPKVSLEIKPGTDGVWAFNAVVTEYSGSVKNYSYSVNINDLTIED